MIYQEKVGFTTIRYVGLFNPDLPKELGDLSTQACEAVFKYWRRKWLPRHFTASAFAQYGGRFPHVYEYRTGRQKRDLRRKVKVGSLLADNRAPLVASGKLMRDMMHGTVSLRSSGSGATAKLQTVWPNLPKYAYMFKASRAQNRHAIHQELTIVNDEEISDLANVFGVALQNLMNARRA